MKKILKIISSKTFLFVCLGLAIAAITIADSFDPPGAPGRPDTYDVSASECKLKYLPPISDGGSPILGYVIEYKYTNGSRWIRLNKDLNKGLTYVVHNVVIGRRVEFRVSAENLYGRGPTSKYSDPIVFENPHKQ